MRASMMVVGRGAEGATAGPRRLRKRSGGEQKTLVPLSNLCAKYQYYVTLSPSTGIFRKPPLSKSMLTVPPVGLLSKAFLNSRLCSLNVTGLDTLKSALEDTHRRRERGLITGLCHLRFHRSIILTRHLSMQSHINVRYPAVHVVVSPTQRSCHHSLDDPVTWGILPVRYFFNSQTTRWALGASEVMFTNPYASFPCPHTLALKFILLSSLFSLFFSHGQTLETFRGRGIYQPAVDTAIRKLDQGSWVHLFGEGKINQSDTYPKDSQGFARLPRFKWGVSVTIPF